MMDCLEILNKLNCHQVLQGNSYCKIWGKSCNNTPVTQKAQQNTVQCFVELYYTLY